MTTGQKVTSTTSGIFERHDDIFQSTNNSAATSNKEYTEEQELMLLTPKKEPDLIDKAFRMFML